MTRNISHAINSVRHKFNVCPQTYRINGLPPLRYGASSRKLVCNPMLTKARQNSHPRIVLVEPLIIASTSSGPPSRLLYKNENSTEAATNPSTNLGKRYQISIAPGRSLAGLFSTQ